MCAKLVRKVFYQIKTIQPKCPVSLILGLKLRLNNNSTCNCPKSRWPSWLLTPTQPCSFVLQINTWGSHCSMQILSADRFQFLLMVEWVFTRKHVISFVYIPLRNIRKYMKEWVHMSDDNVILTLDRQGQISTKRIECLQYVHSRVLHLQWPYSQWWSVWIECHPVPPIHIYHRISRGNKYNDAHVSQHPYSCRDTGLAVKCDIAAHFYGVLSGAYTLAMCRS